MKRTLLLLMSIMTVLMGLVGCSTTETETNSSDEATPEIQIAYIAATPFIDGGWGSSCYAGITYTAEELNAKVYEVENLDLVDFESTTRQFAEMGVDLIISPDWNLSDAFLTVSEDYSDISFAIIDGSYGTENFASVSHNNLQVGFVAGVIAALQSETKVIGYVGGEETPQILEASAGMAAGAKYIDEEMELKSVMSGSWTDVALGKEIGLSLIGSNNVDVLFSFASGVDVGVREAAESVDSCYFIAQPSDLLSESPEITLCSIIQSNEQIIYNIAKSVLDGTFEGGFSTYGFEEGGTVSLGTFNELFDAEKIEIVEKVVADINSGELDIASLVE